MRRSLLPVPGALAAVLLLTTGVLGAQAGLPKDLDAYVGRAMKVFDVPGLSLAIVKDGKVVAAKGYGLKKMGQAGRVDENTLFSIGSTTKAFTAALLATLVDEGKIAWDDPVYQRLPGFQMYDPYVAHELSIRDLITHRSGMGMGEGDLLFIPTTTFTREDIVHRLRFMKPATSFRSRYAYDNLLYIVAGQVIERVTGKSWEANIRERIFQPLGMTTSNLSIRDFKPGDNYAWGHAPLGGRLRPVDFISYDNVAPAGSINSSAAEMARWVQLQLNRGRFVDREGRLFSAAASREMWSAQTIMPLEEHEGPLAALDPKFKAYGLGWGLRDYHGRKLVTHTGGGIGFFCQVMLVPEENLGMVVLTNSLTEAREAVIFRVLDAYFGLPQTDWIAPLKAEEDAAAKAAAEAMNAAGAARDASSHPSLPLHKYAGIYSDAWRGEATLTLENGKLVFSLDHAPAAVGDVEHWQYDTFKVTWRDRVIEDAFLTFSLDADGNIDHMTMKAVSPLADFSFDYQDLWFIKRK